MPVTCCRPGQPRGKVAPLADAGRSIGSICSHHLSLCSIVEKRVDSALHVTAFLLSSCIINMIPNDYLYRIDCYLTPCAACGSLKAVGLLQLENSLCRYACPCCTWPFGLQKHRIVPLHKSVGTMLHAYCEHGPAPAGDRSKAWLQGHQSVIR